VDSDGVVVCKGGRGPFGFKVGEIEQSLIMLLLDTDKAAAKVTPLTPRKRCPHSDSAP
jgi:hypothetical protein